MEYKYPGCWADQPANMLIIVLKGDLLEPFQGIEELQTLTPLFAFSLSLHYATDKF